MKSSYLDNISQTFELAYFLHRKTKIAREITVEALSRVEVLAEAQDKRRYYRPKGRASGRHRSRVSMTDSQLLQRLVYSLSEPHERSREATEDYTEDDLVVRFVAYLVRICLRRNAFHVTLGLSRLLHSYTMNETMSFYELIIQDPERFHGADYFRARKKHLLGELQQRFAPFFKLVRGPQGESRFEPRIVDERLENLVRRTLELVTPWETTCVPLDRSQGDEAEFEAFYFLGPDPDDEHPVEMRRIHALLHPECFAQLTDVLGMARPIERLTVPLCSSGARDIENPPGGSREGKLTEETQKDILEALKRHQNSRRRISPTNLRVRVDATEVACWDPRWQKDPIRISLDPGAELVEVLMDESGKDIPIAVHFLPCLEGSDKEAHGHGVIRRKPVLVKLPRGVRIGFTLLEDSGSFSVEISYRETHPWRVVTHGIRRMARRGVLGGRGTGKPAWSSVGALAILLLVTGVGILYDWPRHDRNEIVLPPQTRGPAVEITQSQKIFVDTFGNDAAVQALRTQLTQQLTDNGLDLVSRPTDAEFILRLDGAYGPLGERLNPTASGLDLILHRQGIQGEVLWRGTVDTASETAAEIVDIIKP